MITEIKCKQDLTSLLCSVVLHIETISLIFKGNTEKIYLWRSVILNEVAGLKLTFLHRCFFQHFAIVNQSGGFYAQGSMMK